MDLDHKYLKYPERDADYAYSSRHPYRKHTDYDQELHSLYGKSHIPFASPGAITQEVVSSGGHFKAEIMSSVYPEHKVFPPGSGKSLPLKYA